MRPREPLVLLAPGAGAPSSSRWMQAWAARLAVLGPVATLDYPYMREGRKTPDRLPALVAAHRAALEASLDQHGRDRAIVLAGKSMGGRVGCHLAVELAGRSGGPVANALICFGYPLVAARGGARRDEVLLALTTPMLFVQGSRDPLCPLDELAAVRSRMRAPSDLFVVEGGDHSLEVRKRAAAAASRSQDDWNAQVLAAVRAFVDRTIGA